MDNDGTTGGIKKVGGNMRTHAHGVCPSQRPLSMSRDRNDSDSSLYFNITKVLQILDSNIILEF